jgi:lipopolysaccharide export system ATP-binding protein
MPSNTPPTPPKGSAKAGQSKATAKPGAQTVKAEAPKDTMAELPKVEPQAAKVEPPTMPPIVEPQVARSEPAKIPARVEPQIIGLPGRGPQSAGLQASGPRLVAASSGLVATHLGKAFKRRPVLRDVTVSVQRGEAVGLLGPNGAGKTTCFYIITGLINADTGTIEMDGVDITHLPMYRRSRMGIGYLPQEASIFRGLTVEENIRAVLEVVEPERDMREAMLDDLLAEFSISHLRRTPALALSGGERRRVEIARALASRPQFMLLDEPLAGIDPIAIGEIRELISHLRKRGIGVLITDHNVRETLDIVDRAYILHDGSVLMDGRPSEIVAHQDVRRVYLGERFSL